MTTTYTYTYGRSIREYVLNEDTGEVTYYTGYQHRLRRVGGHAGKYIAPRTMDRHHTDRFTPGQFLQFQRALEDNPLWVKG